MDKPIAILTITEEADLINIYDLMDDVAEDGFKFLAMYNLVNYLSDLYPDYIDNFNRKRFNILPIMDWRKLEIEVFSPIKENESEDGCNNTTV